MFIATAMLALFALQAMVELRPGWPVIRRLHAWAYGGFYIDERVSRVLLARWPVPGAPCASQPRSSTFEGACS
jgi:hypothetical protein